MNKKNNHASDYILRAASSIKAIRPVYGNIVDFNGKIFLAQEKYKFSIKIDPIMIEADLLSVKLKENFPLVNISQFKIDTAVALELLKYITEIEKELNEKISGVARAVLQTIENGVIDSHALFYSIIEDGTSLLTKKTNQLEIDEKAAAYIIYSCIKPSLIYCSEQLSNYLQADMLWEKGYCPICGSLPGLSILDNQGARQLVCSFCWHQWGAPRVYCTYCENRDSQTLQYFTNEEEKNYRVELCDICKQYIKTVDERKSDYYIYPPLELVSTLHLDIQAQEMGYTSGMGVSLNI